MNERKEQRKESKEEQRERKEITEEQNITEQNRTGKAKQERKHDSDVLLFSRSRRTSRRRKQAQRALQPNSKFFKNNTRISSDLESNRKQTVNLKSELQNANEKGKRKRKTKQNCLKIKKEKRE